MYYKVKYESRVEYFYQSSQVPSGSCLGSLINVHVKYLDLNNDNIYLGIL